MIHLDQMDDSVDYKQHSAQNHLSIKGRNNYLDLETETFGF